MALVHKAKLICGDNNIIAVNKGGRFSTWVVYDVSKDNSFCIDCTVMGTGQIAMAI